MPKMVLSPEKQRPTWTSLDGDGASNANRDHNNLSQWRDKSKEQRRRELEMAALQTAEEQRQRRRTKQRDGGARPLMDKEGNLRRLVRDATVGREKERWERHCTKTKMKRRDVPGQLKNTNDDDYKYNRRCKGDKTMVVFIIVIVCVFKYGPIQTIVVLVESCPVCSTGDPSKGIWAGKV
ncbi:DUF4145 domain-containing protein [Sesbania bispinosa]|nr:DUF4145 domain-containing protein [Sesbania bispinosa]